MKQLWELHLTNNKLHGPLPPAAGMPPALQWLNLSSNALEGGLCKGELIRGIPFLFYRVKQTNK